MYSLCKEFGWTPNQLKEQDAVDVEKLILIMNEIDKYRQQQSGLEADETIILVEDDL